MEVAVESDSPLRTKDELGRTIVVVIITIVVQTGM